MLRVDKSSQVVAAAPRPYDHADRATFTISAINSSGTLVSGAPVTFYLKASTPHHGTSPTAWCAATSKPCSAYVASASTTTDSVGQATITLLGEPIHTVIDVAVSVGNLSSFDPHLHAGLGSLSAAWAPQTGLQSGAGEFIKASALVANVAASANPTLSVAVLSPSGPVSGAHLVVTEQGANPMPASKSLSLSTAKNGIVDVPLEFPSPKTHTLVVKLSLANQVAGFTAPTAVEIRRP